MNIYYLRCIEDYYDNDFEKVDSIWQDKFNILRYEPKFVKDYLIFLKTNKKLNVSCNKTSLTNLTILINITNFLNIIN